MSFYNSADYDNAMAVCANNFDLLTNGTQAACLACKRFAAADESLEAHAASGTASKAVLCPKCGAAALLPDTDSTPVLYPIYRSEMNDFYDRAHGIVDPTVPRPIPVAEKSNKG